MKKAKISLLVIALFAMAGGALAFKAHRGNAIVFKKNAAGTACTRLPGFYAVNPAMPLVTGLYTTMSTNTTAIPTAACSLSFRLGLNE